MKRDKSIDDLHERIDKVESNTAATDSNDDKFKIDKYDDEYYLDIDSEPPRHAYYRHIRVEQCADEYRKKTLECVNDTITQDELDYSLKRKLRVPPEQRYQDEKREPWFHESSWDMRGANGYDGQGCNQFTGCVSECRFYPEHGRIEDEEIIEEHNKLVESLRQENKIVEPPPKSELQRLAKIYRFT